MSVGFRIGSIVDEVGTHGLLHAFFSTISYHLEPDGWGSRFPELMNELYRGELQSVKATKALADAVTAKELLRKCRPDEVVWDIENLSVRPPWGADVSSEITDLSNYFVTSTGRDMFGVLFECLEALVRKGGKMTIETY